MNHQVEMLLLPSRCDEKTRPLVIRPENWETANQLARRNGYSPDMVGGASRTVILYFVRALKNAQERGEVSDPDREWFKRLVAFCESDGRHGFTIERRWEKLLP